jgi:hypothetical protein
MKLVNLDNPVRSGWFADQGLRLDAAPYLSGAYEARKLLERLPKTQQLAEVTQRIFHAGRPTRQWVTDPDRGVPFFSSTDILEADYSYLPFISKKQIEQNPALQIHKGYILITRSGTVGRTAYCRRDADGYAASEHILRVIADESQIASGYLYAFLRSTYGIPIITSQAAGSIIQHIEPHHLVDLPVPRLGSDIELRIHDLIEGAAELRAKYQEGVTAATRDLFTSAGLPELADYAWHKQPRDLGFYVNSIDSITLRAFNFSPRTRYLIQSLMRIPHRTLGDICTKGQLSRGDRFVRVDGDPDRGFRLIGQRQAPWLRPEGRWVVLEPAVGRAVQAPDECVLVASQGTLGENEVFCRATFVTGSWQRKFVFSEHFLRVVSGEPSFPGSYLFAFLRSEVAFRILRSMSAGSKQQDIHEVLRQRIPVPECTPADRERIAETVRQAYRMRDEADVLEDEALAILDDAVKEAAG